VTSRRSPSFSGHRRETWRTRGRVRPCNRADWHNSALRAAAGLDFDFYMVTKHLSVHRLYGLGLSARAIATQMGWPRGLWRSCCGSMGTRSMWRCGKSTRSVTIPDAFPTQRPLDSAFTCAPIASQSRRREPLSGLRREHDRQVACWLTQQCIAGRWRNRGRPLPVRLRQVEFTAVEPAPHMDTVRRQVNVSPLERKQLPACRNARHERFPALSTGSRPMLHPASEVVGRALLWVLSPPPLHRSGVAFTAPRRMPVPHPRIGRS
jgi:hypothetical protein